MTDYEGLVWRLQTQQQLGLLNLPPHFAIVSYDEAAAAIKELLGKVAEGEGERDAWREQFHSAANAASTYADFWEAHSGEFDCGGNYIPHSQMDGDLRFYQVSLAKMRAERDAMAEALADLVAMVDRMDIRPSRGGGVMPVDKATIMFAARAALSKGS